jgi:transposase-like protein
VGGVVIHRSSGARCSIWSQPAARSSTWYEIWGISAQSIYTWRRQDRIDRALESGLGSAEKSELTAAERRIAELEAELAVHGRASELLGKVVPQKAVRGHRGDGR